MKKKQNNPISVSKDVWFYINKDSLQFTVYIEKEVTLFDVPISKIRKCLIVPKKEIEFARKNAMIWRKKYLDLLKSISLIIKNKEFSRDYIT